MAKENRDIVFAVADEDEQVELMKKFNLHESGEDVNVGCRDKENVQLGPRISFLKTIIGI